MLNMAINKSPDQVELKVSAFLCSNQRPAFYGYKNEIPADKSLILKSTAVLTTKTFKIRIKLSWCKRLLLGFRKKFLQWTGSYIPLLRYSLCSDGRRGWLINTLCRLLWRLHEIITSPQRQVVREKRLLLCYFRPARHYLFCVWLQQLWNSVLGGAGHYPLRYGLFLYSRSIHSPAG